MTTIVELACGCTGRTQFTAERGDTLRCSYCGHTTTVEKADYYTNLPKHQKRTLQLLERYESEQPRTRTGTDGDTIREEYREEVSWPLPEEPRDEAAFISFHEARREQARTIRSLQNQEKRLQASLEATEEQLAVLANRLSQASGESPKKIIDETLKHRNLRRRALLDDMNLFWADGD